MAAELLALFNIALIIYYGSFVIQRYRFAQAEGRILGFMLNPLLWFTLFGMIYLLVGQLLSIQAQLLFGLYASESARLQAGLLATYTFIVLFAGYAKLRDRNVRVIELNFGSAGVFLTAGGAIGILILWFVLFQEGPALLSLRDHRVAAHDFYRDVLIGKYKFLMVFQLLVMTMIMATLRIRSNLVCYALILLSVVPVVLVDVFQGGRGMAISTAIMVSIIISMRQDIIPWRLGLGLILWFNTYIMLIRFEADGFQSLEFLYRSISEFYLTQFAFEYIIDTDLSATMLDQVRFILARLGPFGITTGMINQVPMQDDIVEQNLGIGFGLAGNVALEAFFYGGILFALTSPWLIVMIFRLVYSSTFILTFPGLVFLIVIDSSAQNMMRTNFYGAMASFVSMFLSYLIVVTVLTWGRRVLVDLDSHESVEQVFEVTVVSEGGRKA